MLSSRPLVAGLGALATGSTVAVGVSWAQARDVPLSKLHADGHVGPEWPDRHRLRGDPVSGEMESLDTYARTGFDPEGVHPAVRALYERTAAFGMTLGATWHRPFRLGARLATRWTRRIEQLALPGPGEEPRRLDSDLFDVTGVAAQDDPREAVRLWVRTDRDTGEGVFVALYGTHVRDGERLLNVAVPLPRCSLATIMRIQHCGEGIELTTDCPDGGLYLHTKHGGFALPASQRFRVLPADEYEAPAPPDGVDRRDADLFADQRIRLLGRPLVTVRYAATRRDSDTH